MASPRSPRSPRSAELVIRLGLVLSAIFLATGCAAPQIAKLAVGGDGRVLRERAPGAPASSPGKPSLLYLALDGVGRDILYDELAAGRMPQLAALLGGENGRFPHAHFEARALSVLPSSTMAAWVSTMSGAPPAVHGVLGNEYFVRESRTFACPAPVSFSSAVPTLQIFTEGYLDGLSSVPTLYERMREREPDILIWVGMHFVYRGADKLLLARKTVLAKAFEGFLEKKVQQTLADKESRRVFAELDEGVVDRVVDELGASPAPDVLTVYLAGTDLYAHVAHEGPDEARRTYLREVADPVLGRLRGKLAERGALAERSIVVSSDHGHTQVVHDEAHALINKADEGLRALLRRVGFRPRAPKRDVPADDPFSAVVAHGGAMAYVYLADRSVCPIEKDVCEWKLPPRYEDDVLPTAQAIFKNNQDGSIVPAMKGAVDVVLVRRPKPFAEVDLPFEVYVGEGRTMPVAAYFAEHPHPSYVAVEARLRDFAVGPHGERAGDIVVLAHNGECHRPEDRYYFAEPYHSWHGSPSKQDSQIPLIVASPGHDADKIGAFVGRILGDRPYQQKVADLLLGLRAGGLGKSKGR